MSSPAVRNIKRLQPQDKRSRKIFFDFQMTAKSTQDCHWRLRRFFGKDNHLGCPKQGVSVDVRLQSAPCSLPTRKDRRQTRNDAVHQLDHARFCRRGRTKRSSVPAPRHGGCVREGDRVRAWVWPFLKLETREENWRQGGPLSTAERGQAKHASRCTRIS